MLLDVGFLILILAVTDFPTKAVGKINFSDSKCMAFLGFSAVTGAGNTGTFRADKLIFALRGGGASEDLGGRVLHLSFSSLIVGIFAFEAGGRMALVTDPAGLTLWRLTASAVQLRRVSLSVSS